MPTKPSVHTIYLCIRISPELRVRLKRASKAKGVTSSEMVRRLVLNYLEGLSGVE